MLYWYLPLAEEYGDIFVFKWQKIVFRKGDDLDKKMRSKSEQMTRICRRYSIVNLAIVVCIWALIHIVSENWWMGAALNYVPRLPYAIPAFLLLIPSIIWHRISCALNLLSIAIVIGPIAGFQFPQKENLEQIDAQGQLKVVSCNVQYFEPYFPSVLQEILALKPDIVALQEARQKNRQLENAFFGWHTIHFSEYWIGSKYPIRPISECHYEITDRITAIKLEVDSPFGKFLLTNLHLTTARDSLLELRGDNSIIRRHGQRQMEHATNVRGYESARTSAFVFHDDQKIPKLVIGDFNTPSSSSLYRTAWGGLVNAFDVAGWGFGYTSPCDQFRFWPDYLPWLRIDHILASSHWKILSCQIGEGNGSDHRLIVATLSLR